MRTAASILALASAASAQIKGFNYGSTFTNGAAKTQADFENEFTTAANLEGTSGFTSARLYTMVQGGTASDPISAIPAAINTNTSLLLGLWASGGDAAFSNEILALRAAIDQYGEDFTSIVDGIAVGSEDLYRNSPIGIEAGSYAGANPDTLVRYIEDTRDLISGTLLEGAPIGHVDTWTAWVNGSNQAVIDAVDWLGMDAYPYFQDTVPNEISRSNSLFSDALGQTAAAGGGKPVWITETGHPVSGRTVGQSVASVDNAERYWREVGCPLFDESNVWWYTLQDAAPDTPNPSFGIVGNELSTRPLFDLSCDDVSSSASSAIASAVASTSRGSETATASESFGDSGGSPTGLPSSQVSLEQSSTVTPSTSYPGPTGTGSPFPGPGTNGTYSTTTAPPAPSSTESSPPVGAARGLESSATGAAFLAVFAAALAL